MFIADLHIHSKYSRATSKDCEPEALDLWARRKGIDLLGTGDFTHPAWRDELREKLVPAEDGLYVLKDEYRITDTIAGGDKQPRFVLSGEISSIYKKNGKVRKVHNVVLLPSIDAAEELSIKLETIGNLHSDGRPILGLDSRDLLEITLEVCPEVIFIPAHIWTPHFSLFGAFSGFDTIEECFEDLTPHIHALETGLSSDPAMNWRLSALDRYTLVSNSDAHSPAKLGREANLLDTEMSYTALRRALTREDPEAFRGTIEFFPEEGKYHLDGHRKCQLCLKPSETLDAAGVCPVCGGKITIGVLHRVEQLADREEGYILPGAPSFDSIVPLPEVIASCAGVRTIGAKINAQYERLLQNVGPEFYILREAPIQDIRNTAGPLVAEGIQRMRKGQVELSPGYDGEYGKIQLIDEKERDLLSGQFSFFPDMPAPKKRKQREKVDKAALLAAKPIAQQAKPASENSNAQQEEAITCSDRVVAVVAGPGTGKTRTLVSRIAYLVQQRGVSPAEITAVTFTNKAAAEMRERLVKQFGSESKVKPMTIGTFHAISMDLLPECTILDEYDALSVVKEVLQETGCKITPKKALNSISKLKNGVPQPELPEEVYQAYCDRLQSYGVMNFDDILLRALELELQETGRFKYLLVDEFQDINDIQYRLIQKWAERSASIFIIGDPNQSIYGFRGSDANCFQRFKADYPDVREIALLHNYRSTPEILECANRIISNPLTAQKESGAKVRLVTNADDFSEGIYIAKEINKIVGGIDMLDTETNGGKSHAAGFSDIAILYRTHRQVRVLEKCLRTEGIPYIVNGRDSFLEDSTVRGTVSFFRYLLNQQDMLSLRTALKTVMDCPDSKLQGYMEALPEKFTALVEKYLPALSQEKPQQLLTAWAEELSVSDNAPMENLLHSAVFYQDIPSFLQDLVLGQESDVKRSGSKSYTPDAVSLMTLHGAKGLEFPVVFLCGVNQGTLPLEAPGREIDLEEERRLFYVGATRGKNLLTLLTTPEQSSFLKSIPKDSFDVSTTIKKKPDTIQLSLFDF